MQKKEFASCYENMACFMCKSCICSCSFTTSEMQINTFKYGKWADSFQVHQHLPREGLFFVPRTVQNLVWVGAHRLTERYPKLWHHHFSVCPTSQAALCGKGQGKRDNSPDKKWPGPSTGVRKGLDGDACARQLAPRLQWCHSQSGWYRGGGGSDWE